MQRLVFKMKLSSFITYAFTNKIFVNREKSEYTVYFATSSYKKTSIFYKLEASPFKQGDLIHSTLLLDFYWELHAICVNIIHFRVNSDHVIYVNTEKQTYNLKSECSCVKFNIKALKLREKKFCSTLWWL